MLVFSQFTSMLAIVREHLDEEKTRLRIPGRQNTRPRRAGRTLPDRSGLQAVSDQPESRRPGT